MIHGIWQKLGNWPTELINSWKTKSNWIWFHSVSVGELNAVWPLIIEINKLKPNYPIMLSCTTKASYNLACKLSYEKKILVFYFPFDLPHIVKSLLNYAKIKLFIIAETEIWPNILTACKEKNVPVLLINARLSDKSFRNYYLLKFYFKKIINLFTEVLAQSTSDGEKFIKLGLDSKKLKVTGNIKFSQVQSSNGKDIPLSSTFTLDTKNITNIIFASTHRGEEKIAINTYKKFFLECPDLRLTIAPRHLERIEEITDLVSRNGFKPLLKTNNIRPNTRDEILIFNTIGELSSYFKFFQITIIGGTFVRIGGHNFLEPIRAKSYTIIGPYDFKIKELSSIFKENGALVQVNNTNDLIIKIKEAIENKEIRNDAINNGIKIINENQRIFIETTKQILTYL